MAQLIRIAHSPDSDDAFMFYGLASGAIRSPGLSFEHVLKDIESLNHDAMTGCFEITAISIHAYAYLADRYALLSSGASMGENYGPMVVARRPYQKAELKNLRIAIPGELTSATLALQLALGPVQTQVMPFDEIMAAVRSEKVAAGLIIHEGQLTYAQEGLHLCLDLGRWWHEETGLPLPLGGNGVRKDLGAELMKKLARLQRQSIVYGLEHRSAALAHSGRYARDLTAKEIDRFVGMYVNGRTVDYGEDGKKAVQLFLKKGYDAKLLPKLIEPEFIDE